MRCYIGLGSNLGDPEAQLRAALAELAELPRSRFLRASSLYRGAPMGPQDQPDFVNAVAEIETELSAERLLAELQALEARHGRVRDGPRWGPRSLDLDLLLYGEMRIDTPGLTVPHPGVPVRAFVLYPLHEIAPDLQVPGLGPLRELLITCPAAGLARLGAVA